MKRFAAAVWLAVSLLVSMPLPASAQNFPRPVGFVNDFAGVLSRGTVADLESRLAALEKETTVEVAVVTVKNLGGSTIEQYAVGLFENWGIGKAGKDNGVLFILAKDERKIKIEVGYGLEGIITDGRAGRILDNSVVPYLRDGEFDLAMESGVIDIEQYIRDGTPPSIVEENPIQKAIDGFRFPSWVLIALGIGTVYILGFMARTKSIWLGGIWGVILGIILGFGFGKTEYIVELALGMGVFGLILDIILSSNYRWRSSSGLPTGWYSSGGGFRGSSGGFGGFGGGHSGGGGSSRGW